MLRARLAGTGAALAAALAVSGCTGEASSADGPRAATASTVALAAPSGFRVAVDDEQAPAPGSNGAGQVSWTSRWRLSWDPVPGATSYAVAYGTSEGVGDGEPAVQPGTELVVEAAAGTSPAARVQQDRRAGLLFSSSQLLASVAALRDGEQGPRSPWFPVGDVPPDGRPLGTTGPTRE